MVKIKSPQVTQATNPKQGDAVVLEVRDHLQRQCMLSLQHGARGTYHVREARTETGRHAGRIPVRLVTRAARHTVL